LKNVLKYQFVGGNASEKLIKVRLNVVPNEECNHSYQGKRKSPKGVIQSQMCAKSKGAIVMDTCQGDSGGPLQIKLLGQNELIPFLVGVTSFGIGCASGSPSVYTRVSSYIDWIETEVNETFDPIGRFKILCTIWIWAETACSMLQEKGFFEFQIRLIQSPKDLEV
jgi:secreted trypsin-like serine protease